MNTNLSNKKFSLSTVKTSFALFSKEILSEQIELFSIISKVWKQNKFQQKAVKLFEALVMSYYYYF